VLINTYVSVWHKHFFPVIQYTRRSLQWPRGLRRRSFAARLLRSWFRIPPGAWMFVVFVLSGRGLCDGLITRPEESYRLWRAVLYDQGNLNTKKAKARYRAVKIQPQWVVTPGKQTIPYIYQTTYRTFFLSVKLSFKLIETWSCIKTNEYLCRTESLFMYQ
jgi:hypothetical protein